MSFKQFCKQHKPTQTELFSDFYDLFKDNIEIKNKKIAVEKLKTIITATFKLSATQSFANMSLRELSDETQISMGGLYSYIKNKQQLSLYIHQFLNHYAEKILNQSDNNLESLIKTHVYLSEILQPWFFFAFMESKNLNKAMRKYAIKSELMMESHLIQVIQQGQADEIYSEVLSAETVAAHIKPLLHDWYLKRWKYKQRKISVDDFCETTLLFINNGLIGEAKQTVKANKMNNITDKPNEVRKEDSLDKHKLTVYLGKHLDNFNINDQLSIQQYAGGASNLTYLLQWSNKQAILRTSPRGANIKGAHDMGREYKVLSLLEGHFTYSPKALLYCEDEQIIGRPFYLMQKVEGIIPRKSFPIPVNPQQASMMCKDLIDVHIALHEIDLEKTGLSDLGKAEGYIQRQISGWNQRYKNARLEDSMPADDLMQWLEENQPQDNQTSLIHNDYKFDNVVLSAEPPHKIIAVLDWEMTTIGSPLMDLGCSLAYWIEKNDPPAMQAIRMMPTHIDGMMTRQQIVEYYGKKRNMDMTGFNYYYKFGLFRLAVIVQQIYCRYAQGKTNNPAFKSFGEIAKVLIAQAQSIENLTN